MNINVEDNYENDKFEDINTSYTTTTDNTNNEMKQSYNEINNSSNITFDSKQSEEINKISNKTNTIKFESKDDYDFLNDIKDDNVHTTIEYNNNHYKNIQFLLYISNCDETMIEEYIAKNFNITCQDRHGWNALHHAVLKGFDSILRLLLNTLDKTSDRMKTFINQQEYITGWTPLHVS